LSVLHEAVKTNEISQRTKWQDYMNESSRNEKTGLLGIGLRVQTKSDHKNTTVRPEKN
jgi:hypothetical protein